MSGLESSSAQIAAAARAQGRLALDTEFIGEGRYRTLLCLVALAVPSAQGTSDGEVLPATVALLDPLAEDFDGEPLAKVLADPEVELIVHAGRHDVALLRRLLSSDVRNVFDTQIAAGFLGLPAQSSYEGLVSELLGLRLAKQASFTRWDSRPLSQEQLTYAREDVTHLLPLALALEARLREMGRLQWAREECEPLAEVNDDRDPTMIFSRLPRVRGLSAPSRGAAWELVLWRENSASQRNRPVQSVLADPVLLEIARRKPSSRAQLENIRGVGEGSVRRNGGELLDAVRRGVEQPAEPLDLGPRPATSEPSDLPLMALAEALARTRAREANLAYELVGSRADLQAIVTAHRLGSEEPTVRTLQGWRRELVGAEVLELLDGRLSLSVASAGRVSVSPSEDEPRPIEPVAG